MATFTVYVQASKLGSIGSKYGEKRTYEVIASDQDTANEKAIKRAYEDGLEHVLVNIMGVAGAREVEAHDLELYAINTGELYQTHKDLVGETIGAWLRHVRNRVIPHYCREIEPVWSSADTTFKVAESLRAYYERHAQESAQ